MAWCAPTGEAGERVWPALRTMGVVPRKYPLAFFSYRWVRYQERGLMSIGPCTVSHAKRRLRIAIAPQGIRRPAARPSHETGGGVENRRTIIPRKKLWPDVDERCGGAAEHHQAGALSLFRQQGRHTAGVLPAGCGADRGDAERNCRSLREWTTEGGGIYPLVC